jgi:Ca2+-transporting ATPase
MRNIEKNAPFHALSPGDTQRLTETSAKGLTEEEARARLAEFGPNTLKEKKGRSVAAIALDQVKSVMIIILVIAAVISALVGELADCIIVLAIVLLNAVLGVAQELKAERSLEALRKMSAPSAKVIRAGRHLVIPASKVVVGDVVTLDAGDRVPADIRLTHSASLRIEEAALTGESVPSEKDAAASLPEDCPLGDRANMAFSSSVVVYGRGEGIVAATGMDTQVGRIAELLQSQHKKETPLQKKLNQVGRVLGFAAVGICVLLFIVGILYGKGVLEMFMIAVSLAVAAIPEGLPAIATIVLALGVQRMVARHAIIRTLPSVETLGSTTVICSDKTGTLTQNKMTVMRIWTGGDITQVGQPLQEGDALLITAAVLCNDSHEENGTLLGDPTETALIDLGIKTGFLKPALAQATPRVEELPFDSIRKLMTTVHTADSGFIAYTKGAVDELLKRCTHIRTDKGVRPIDKIDISNIHAMNESMAKEALRVLGFGMRDLADLPKRGEESSLESGLTFIGLSGMIDPPRPEAIEAVQKCREAGIRTVMITGDHVLTAQAIAHTMGILGEGDVALKGQELDQMDDQAFASIADKVSVYARVSPENKVRIVGEWKRRGAIVAMTGDGVNDAPALKSADIGAAMGIVGTDVAKDAADMVLTDDNFATIVSAVEEGRRIADNILKAIQFLLSSNVGEILVLFIATLFNLGVPLLPIHILWVNLVTDSLPALALGIDPAQRGIMQRPPAKSLNLFTPGMVWRISYQGMMIGALSLAAFLIGKKDGLAAAQTMAFTVLALSQLVHAFNVRSVVHSAFAAGSVNHWLWRASLASAALVAVVLFIPGLSQLFSVVALSWEDALITAGLVIAPLVIVELFKLFKINTIGKER